MKKYFLTIVIPAYNCKSTLTNALASIAMQRNNEEIEVIVVDDCSTESYEDIINKFNTTIDIKLLTLEKNSGPGVARQKGIDEAQGEWITFLDADDTIAFGAYLNVKDILENEKPDMLITDFFEQREDFKTYVPHSKDTVWVHGKYYNKHFLEKNNIRCHNSLRTHEDIYFNHLVLNTSNNIKSAQVLTYIWNYKEDSLTRRIYNDCHGYVEEHLSDYVESTIGPCLELIKKDPMYKLKVKNLMLLHPLYLYFYIQSFKFNLPNDWYKHNLLQVKKVLNTIKEIYNMNIEEIYLYTKSVGTYSIIRNACERGVGVFIEQQTYKDFLNECYNIKEEENING